MRTQSEERPVYSISIAAQLLEVHPQTLRIYERIGLLEPARSTGNIRLYSVRDIERAHQIRRLTQDLGVNLAGVEVIFELLEEMENMRRRMDREIERLRRGYGDERPQTRRRSSPRRGTVWG